MVTPSPPKCQLREEAARGQGTPHSSPHPTQSSHCHTHLQRIRRGTRCQQRFWAVFRALLRTQLVSLPFGCRHPPKSALGEASVTLSGCWEPWWFADAATPLCPSSWWRYIYISTRLEPVHDGVERDCLSIPHHCQVAMICQRRGGGSRTLACSSLGGTSTGDDVFCL